MNKKSKILLMSIVSIVVCLMLISGATLAMFTDESRVNIAITGGRIDLEAQINAQSLKVYSKSYDYEQGKYVETETLAVEQATDGEYAAAFTVVNNIQTGGLATANATTVTLSRMAPLDRATFDIEIVNKSDIDAAYRIYVLHDGELYDALNIAFEHGNRVSDDGYTYINDTTSWTTISHSTSEGDGIVENVGVEIVFPDSGEPSIIKRDSKVGDNKYQEAECSLTFVVEAYQAYAKLSEISESERTWLVSNQAGLTAVSELCNTNDVIILQGESWDAASFETERELNIKIKGASVGEFVVNAPNSEIVIENDVLDLKIVAIKDGTAKIAGEIENLLLTKGKVEILATGSVLNLTTNPIVDTIATFVIPENKTVNIVNANGLGSTIIIGNVKEFNIEEGTTITFNGLEVEKDQELTYIADGFYNKENSFHIMDKEGLCFFANKVNQGDSFEGKTITLENDIDLKDVEWTPIGGNTMGSYPGITFTGIFDGNNKNISNLTSVSNAPSYACAGLFGAITGTIKNVNLINVNVTSTHYAGAIVAYASNCGEVINCTVNGGNVTSLFELISGEYDNGDKVGGIAGYGLDVITECKVENLTIKGYRDIGGIIGLVDGGEVTNNVVKNVTLINDRTYNYKNYKNEEDFDVNEIIGEELNTCVVEGNSFENVKFNKIAPIVVDEGTAQQAINGAISSSSAGDKYVLPSTSGEESVKIPNISNNITLIGKLDDEGKPETKINANGSGSVASVPNGVTFENLEFDFGGSSYHGFQHAGKITFVNCVLNGLFFSYGDMEFIDCVFNAPEKDYSMWLYGDDAIFKGCTFNGYGKWFNVYNEGNAGERIYNIEFEDCKFVNLGTKANKAGVNVKDSCGAKQLRYNVSITNCEVEGLFPSAKTDDTLNVIDPLVQVDDITGKNGFITVTLDGEIKFSNLA